MLLNSIPVLIALAVAMNVSNRPTTTVPLPTGATACDEACKKVYENEVHVGNSCVAGTEGRLCQATVATCGIERTCGTPEDPEGEFEELQVITDDGMVLANALVCWTGDVVFSEERVGYTHERQWSALAFHEAQF